MKISKFYLFLSILLLFPLESFSQNDRRNQLISVINEELNEVSRLNKQTGSRNPRLLLRMAELLLEKARIIKDSENSKFLGLSAKKRRRANKKKYFRKSRKFFVQAQKACYYILKRFPKFRSKGDVYYILAYNAKEFQQPGRAEKFFVRALKHAAKKSRTSYRARLALAEIFYNKREYAKAIPLYQKALTKRDNKWWTKDAYNLAWCYFRTKKKRRAIGIMRDIYRLSKGGKFIDMSFAVERDLAFFYTDSGNMSEAVKFYRSIGKDIAKNLLKVAKFLQQKGKYSMSEKALTEALKYKTDERSEIDIQVSLLVLYERFGKIRSHLKVSKTLFSKFKAGSLDDSDKAILIFHVKKMSATLQGQVVSKRYRTQKRLRQRKAKRAVAYFKILAEVEPSTRHLSYFHAAETFYSINFFESAIPLYETASQKAKETGDIKIFNLATDGILAAISGRGVKASTKEKYLIPAYESYLEKNPNSAKSSKIYQRLFSVYFDKKNLPKAEAILLTFRDKYPKNLKVHEAMLGKIMDHYKKNNNRDGIKIWINRINNGEIKVSEKYSRKIKRLLLSIQFENVEKANAKGDKKRALKLYLEIYKDRESTKDARKNASYNIAVLFHELGQIEKSYGWAQRSLGLMSPVDVQKFQTAFLTVAAELFNKRMFKESAEIYHRSFEKLCSRKTRNKKILFKNAIIIYLAEAEIDKASKVLGASYKCNLAKKVLIEAEFDLLNAMITQKNWDTIPGRISKLEKDLKIQAQLIEPLYKLSIAYRDSGKLDKQIKMNKKILNYYKSLKRKKVKIPLAALDIVAGLKLMRLDADFSKISKIKLSFPEARYNSRLKKKFAQLDSITTKAVAVLEIGSGRGIVKAYRYLISSYRGLVKEIREFVPAKKPEAYVKSFRKTMKSITRPILKKANEFNREALRHIRSNKILSPDNVYFLSNRALPLDIQYSYYQDGLIMDKGGKK